MRSPEYKSAAHAALDKLDDAARRERRPGPYSIGEVVFVQEYIHQQLGTRKRDVGLSGQPRIDALRAAFRREPIPNNLTLFVYGVGEITWEEVAWETAGKRVTG